MSSLTQCNCCSLKNIKKRAKQKGQKVTVLSDAVWGMGGVNVYIHPNDVKVRNLAGGESGERTKYRVAWFMELGKVCSC